MALLPAPRRISLLGNILLFTALALTFVARLGASIVAPLAPELRTRIEPLLSPVADMLAQAKIPVQAGDAGVVLLNERLILVEPDGRRILVRHALYRANNDAGVKSLADDVTTYRKNDQTIFLGAAETIQADGTRQEVAANAILIQSPQRQAEYSLYDDQAELKLIFPNVKPGSVTRVLVVIEDKEPRIQGEFFSSLSWSTYWPLGTQRTVLEMPADMHARLRSHALGSRQPKPVIEKLPGERVRSTWTVTNLPMQTMDHKEEPIEQTGPLLNLSTMESWEGIGQWYRGLLKGRDQAGTELEALAREWTNEAKTREEIIARVHAKVANQIRYVGLEFGIAGYQPHPCEQIWKNQYGDCKDKANLMTALLRSLGIEARIALLNTTHSGWIDRRSPTYNAFTHAIVAIPQPRGGHLFCDPTIARSVPGMLAPSSGDRDALLIGDKAIEWARTPTTEGGRLDYAFDLSLAPNGELSGWLTLTVSGYYAAYDRERYVSLDKKDLHSELSGIVRSFYPGAEVIDVELGKGIEPEPFVAKAYLVSAATEASTGKGQALSFPKAGALLSNLGTKAERSTVFFAWKDTSTLKTTIKLPKGLTIGTLPKAFRADSAAFSAKASWTESKGTCIAQFEATVKQDQVKPPAFRDFYQDAQSLRTWLGQPVTLVEATKTKKAAGKNGNAEAEEEPEVDLPRLPTIDGQLALLDRRYPYNGPAERRRRALELAQQYFPGNGEMIFRAGGRLVLLDWNANKNQEAHARAQVLLRDFSTHVQPDTVAWLRTTDALILNDLGQRAEALAMLRAIAEDTTLWIGRRAIAALRTAEMLIPEKAAEALALIKTIAEQPEGATQDIENMHARLLLLTGDKDALAVHLARLRDTLPSQHEELLCGMLEASASWKLPQETESAPTLAALIGMAVRTPGERLSGLLAETTSAANNETVRKALATALKQTPLSRWNKTEAKADTLDAVDAALKEIDARNDADAGLRLCLQTALRADLGDQFPRRLWLCAIYAEWLERRAPQDNQVPLACDALVALCEQLTSGSTFHVEGRLLQATRRKHAGDRPGEQAIYKGILELPKAPEDCVVATHRRLADSLLAEGDLEKTLQAMKPLEAHCQDYPNAVDTLVNGVLINLHLGHTEEALRLLARTELTTEATLNRCSSREQLLELRAMAATEKNRALWKHNPEWHARWIKLAVQNGLSQAEAECAVPNYGSVVDMATAVQTARGSNNTKELLRQTSILMSAARWQPSLANEAAGLAVTLGPVLPKEGVRLMELSIQLLRTEHPKGFAKERNRQVLLAAALIDARRHQEAGELLRRWFAEPVVDDALHTAMLRVRVMHAKATGLERATSIKDLENLLKTEDPAAQRQQDLLDLCDLLAAEKREAELIALVDKELAGGQSPAGPGRQALIERREKASIEAGMDKAIREWLSLPDLAWYQTTYPTTLADPTLGDLESLLQRIDSRFNGAEKIKLLLLAAQDPKRPAQARAYSFRLAVETLLTQVPDIPTVERLARSVVDNERFDIETRLVILVDALGILAAEGKPAEYKALRAHPLTERYSDSYKAYLGQLDKVASCNIGDKESIAATLRELTTVELTQLSISQVFSLFARLVDLGALEEAEQVASNAASWQLHSNLETNRQTYQLTLVRSLRFAREQYPVHEALRQVVARRHGKEITALPAAYAQLKWQHNTVALEDREQTRIACIHKAITRGHMRQHPGFWLEYLRALDDAGAPDGELAELLRAGLEATTDDAVRAQFVAMAMMGVDGDNPAVVALCDAEFAPYRKPAEQPNTYQVIRLHELYQALRKGKTLDPEVAFADVKDARFTELCQIAGLDLLSRHGDPKALETRLDRCPAELLLNPLYLEKTLPILRQLRRKEEVKLAEDVARKELRAAVADTWITAEPIMITRACVLADTLGDASLLPEAWLKQLQATQRNPTQVRHANMVRAELLKDWVRLETEAAYMNRHYPRHYRWYWHRALALRKLGREAEAIPALETYVAYCLDERNHSEALQVLAQLKKKAARN